MGIDNFAFAREFEFNRVDRKFLIVLVRKIPAVTGCSTGCACGGGADATGFPFIVIS